MSWVIVCQLYSYSIQIVQRWTSFWSMTRKPQGIQNFIIFFHCRWFMLIITFSALWCSKPFLMKLTKLLLLYDSFILIICKDNFDWKNFIWFYVSFLVSLFVSKMLRSWITTLLWLLLWNLFSNKLFITDVWSVPQCCPSKHLLVQSQQ